MKYKAGQILLCVKNFYMDDGEEAYTKGKTYLIESSSDEDYNIPDNNHSKHTMRDEHLNYFTINREEKLKRILMSEETFYKDLNFTTPVRELKSRGYTFQELYASNYKSYRKEFGSHKEFTIWLWVKGKTIEINDWYNYTSNVIDFYKNNFDSWKVENNKLPKPINYMVMHANHNTGEVKLKDFKEYYKMICGSEKKQSNYYEKYKGWREIVIAVDSEEWQEVLKEVEFLTNI